MNILLLDPNNNDIFDNLDILLRSQGHSTKLLKPSKFIDDNSLEKFYIELRSADVIIACLSTTFAEIEPFCEWALMKNKAFCLFQTENVTYIPHLFVSVYRFKGYDGLEEASQHLTKNRLDSPVAIELFTYKDRLTPNYPFR